MGVGMAWKCLGYGDSSSGEVVEGLLDSDFAQGLRPGVLWALLPRLAREVVCVELPWRKAFGQGEEFG